jgi:hypothetical protein
MLGHSVAISMAAVDQLLEYRSFVICDGLSR